MVEGIGKGCRHFLLADVKVVRMIAECRLELAQVVAPLAPVDPLRLLCGEGQVLLKLTSQGAQVTAQCVQRDDEHAAH